ncbi:hypothetical protein BDFG_04915 [Blastomyces dermatitidis ATCC 26199]|nr:hypothetical protein BDFG_04915 [Blastomyces dermatitidis ATCC 26199]
MVIPLRWAGRVGIEVVICHAPRMFLLLRTKDSENLRTLVRVPTLSGPPRISTKRNKIIIKSNRSHYSVLSLKVAITPLFYFSDKRGLSFPAWIDFQRELDICPVIGHHCGCTPRPG